MKNQINDIYTFNSLGNVSQEEVYLNYIGGIELIEEECVELEDTLIQFLKDNQEWTPDNRADALDAIVDLFVVVTGAAYRVGFSQEEVCKALDIINTENLKKYCETKKEAVESVKQYEGDSRYVDVHHEYIEDHDVYAVIGKVVETGNRKVLKGVSWNDPKEQLKSILLED